eukprot:TRINITY_DN4621_c0_g1_i3.p2 TRINITY_DN4621_c0_g1~~TRINITY_DN4621_c0_g1_i3.p2  ORF type:complete len:294 (-),score=41.57 TRINITY_DN4621_c0_g1_i3:1527-2408(-)
MQFYVRDDTDTVHFVVPRIIACVVYVALATVALVQLIRIYLFKRRQSTTWAKLATRLLLCGFIFLQCFVRILWFAYEASMSAEIVFLSHASDFLLNVLPTVFFISAYTVLLHVTIDLIFSMRGKQVGRKALIITFSINAFLYFMFFLMILLDYVHFPTIVQNPDTPEMVTPADVVLSASFIVSFVAIAVTFFVYLVQLRNEFGWSAQVEPDLAWLLRKATATAVFSTLSFTARCIYLLVTLTNTHLQIETWVVVTYYLIFDAAPSTVMLLLMARPPALGTSMCTLSKEMLSSV